MLPKYLDYLGLIDLNHEQVAARPAHLQYCIAPLLGADCIKHSMNKHLDFHVGIYLKTEARLVGVKLRPGWGRRAGWWPDILEQRSWPGGGMTMATNNQLLHQDTFTTSSCTRTPAPAPGQEASPEPPGE